MIRLFLSVLLPLLFCVACSPALKEAYPSYEKPSPAARIGFVDLGEAFILMRPEWIASGLDIPPDSVHARLAAFTDSALLAALRVHFPAAQALAASERQSFLPETQRLASEVYIKTKLPPQGVVVAPAANLDYLLIIHEYTVGADLGALQFYDYTQANAESHRVRKALRLSGVASWTLWSNPRQLPLLSGVSEAHVELSGGVPSRDQFARLTRSVMENILGEF
jgi:hypothetical protein